jgi:hypothetical protein
MIRKSQRMLIFREKLKSTRVLVVVTRISMHLIFYGCQLWTWDPVFFLLALLFFFPLLTVCPMCSSLISYTAVRFF